MSENNCSEYFEDKGAKPSVTSLVNLMNKTAKAGSSRSSSPTSISSKNELNDNKRTLSSSSLASSVSVSSSSNLFKNNNQTSDYVEDSSIGVFDESTGSKCLNKLSQVCRSNRSSISTSTTNNLDDFNDEHLLMPNYNDDSAICNFTKLKAKKEDNQLATMMNKCQTKLTSIVEKPKNIYKGCIELHDKFYFDLKRFQERLSNLKFLLEHTSKTHFNLIFQNISSKIEKGMKVRKQDNLNQNS
ncbi:hypothetical protein BpHYR1_013843 [Brachionus plicatilis]|uniref:Uncharacterized protein n=1 Tax=Brachionus plicatilis TaxID=10195 RepID=A0A3M7QCB6_BRAPC|nr:hypothetical protein BpHYR1_013843 [Brachionus plicatilis]